MPIADADKNVHDMRNDRTLRLNAYECGNGGIFKVFLISRGYVFTECEG